MIECTITRLPITVTITMAHNSLLSDFYGLSASAAAEEEKDVQTQAQSQSQPHSHSQKPQYEAPQRHSATSLEDENFNVQRYVDSLLATQSMRDLIQHDNAMIASKKALDSEMQTLVYDNYNKFITATDMIRAMKGNVESMDGAMADLQSTMAALSGRCSSIERSLAPNRSKVEQLVSASRLLHRLEFLFELPSKLNKSIEHAAYEQAVAYFVSSSLILQQYIHLKSFQRIRNESQIIMDGLKQEMKKKLRETIGVEAAGPGGSTTGTSIVVGKDKTSDATSPSHRLSIDDQLSYLAMLLLDLNDAEAHSLLLALLEKQKKLFRIRMKKAMEIGIKQEEEHEGGMDAKKRKMSHVTKRKDESKAKEDDEANVDEEDGAADTPTSSSDSTSPDSSSHSPHSSSLDHHASSGGGGGVISALRNHFLTPLLLFMDLFLATFIRPYEAKKVKYQRALNAANQASTATSTSATAARQATSDTVNHLTTSLQLLHLSIHAFTDELFNEYFQLVSNHLNQHMKKIHHPNEDASRIILAWTALIGDVQKGLEPIVKLMPSAPTPTPTHTAASTASSPPSPSSSSLSIKSRALHLIDHSIRLMLAEIGSHLIDQLSSILCQELHSALLERLPSAKAASNTLLQSLPTLESMTNRMRTKIESGLSLLVVVLSTSEYLPQEWVNDLLSVSGKTIGNVNDTSDNGMDDRFFSRANTSSSSSALSLASSLSPVLSATNGHSRSSSLPDLASQQWEYILNQLVEMFSYSCLRISDGPVYDPAEVSNAGVKLMREKLDGAWRKKHAINSDAMMLDVPPDSPPLFYLYLSQLSHMYAVTELSFAVKALHKFFPPVSSTSKPSTSRSRSPTHSSSSTLFTPSGITWLDSLRSKAEESSQAALQRYVEEHGFRLTDAIRNCVLSSVSGAEVEHPSVLVDRLEQRFRMISRELALMFPPSSDDRDFVHHGLVGGPASGRRADGMRAHGRQESKQPMIAAARITPPVGINRDIQRMFMQKMSTFPGVSIDSDGSSTDNSVASDRISPLLFVCKIAFKALMEFVRMQRVSIPQLHQLQFDLFTLRSELGLVLPVHSDAVQPVLGLLDEVLNSALERIPASELSATSSSTTPISMMSSSISAQSALIEEWKLAEKVEQSRRQKASILMQEDEVDEEGENVSEEESNKKQEA